MNPLLKMFQFPPTIILCHRKKNLKKCSLSGLKTREDCRFFTYPTDQVLDLTDYVFLTFEAPPLSQADGHYGLFLLEGTWRYAQKMEQNLSYQAQLIRRSIPQRFRTAYPPTQEKWIDPEKG